MKKGLKNRRICEKRVNEQRKPPSVGWSNFLSSLQSDGVVDEAGIVTRVEPVPEGREEERHVIRSPGNTLVTHPTGILSGQ